ncbi:MAG TPA: L,D-transpeptidase family protein, partial [Gammaproteobacteria bacterium]
TIDWSLYDEQSFPYALHQPPGTRNPLGRVKFVIPNNYRIYLHDTPQRNLFTRRERTFSSGCIRLEKPLDLATYLLAQEPEAKDAQVERYLANATTRTVALKQPLPIYLVYWTAWADEDGVVQFRDDIYSRDVRLVAALLPEQSRSARVN